LENLLEWSRMEQGLIPFEPKSMLLLPAVTECTSILQDAANNKGIKIQTLVDDKTTVFADHNLLQAVIRNILSNAVKFTPKGGTIIIQGKEDDKNTTISIKDSGIGMDAKILENLFQLDVKTNRKGTDDEPSSGLGLILCKEFVEKHGGKIWVESEENMGSTFYFSLPKNETTAIV
jgi:signal transduction histidine kinase